MRQALIIAAALALTLAGCAQRKSPATIHHAVFFTLRDAGQATELVADCGDLGNIPGVVAWAAGRPVDIGRTTIDGNYDVGLYVGFGSLSDYRVYLDHPIHTRLVNKWKPRWESIFIRDFGGP